jgi:Dolichyl-phosphate-mannose-protein mannosyltransferase
LFLLVGCLLIYFLLRKVGAGVAAALFGAALFLACPLVLRAYVMITADLPLAVLLFLAFVLWWDGAAKGSIKGSIGLSRWIAIGVVLALAGLLKGPQPIAYFALGVGVFVLGRRSWRQLPGLVLAGLICAVPLALWYAAIYRPGDEGIWAAFMRVRPNLIFSGPLQASVRLLSETLPAALAAAVYLIARWFNGRDRAPAGFVVALACYAFIAPIFILFWPGGSAPRYYFPMLPALCVFGGLAYDMLAARRPQIAAPLLLLTALSDLRLGLRRRLAVVADALPADANRGGAHHPTGADGARPDLPDRRHCAQRAALRARPHSQRHARPARHGSGAGLDGAPGRRGRGPAGAAAGQAARGDAARRGAAMAAVAARPVKRPGRVVSPRQVFGA